LKRFRVVKPEIRVLGVDDGVFTPHTKGKALVVGIVFRGGYWLDGVLHTKIDVDGLDAEDRIATMIMSSSHYKQLRVIMLNGVTFAGFNPVNIKMLSAKTKLPVIAVTREKPNFKEIREALKNLPDSEKRWNAIYSGGEIVEVSTRTKKSKIYVQFVGIVEEDAKRILRLTSTRSNVPEPLRVAHLIASGISNAESQSISEQEKV
jgi:endonuclease V-like protein UPF0215 family